MCYDISSKNPAINNRDPIPVLKRNIRNPVHFHLFHGDNFFSLSLNRVNPYLIRGRERRYNL